MPKGEISKTINWKKAASSRLKKQWASGIRKKEPKILKPRKCLFCGQEFQPRHSYNKFCGKTCSGLNQKKRIKKSCEICAKEFEVKLSHLKNSNCCSRKCRDLRWSKLLRSKKQVPGRFYKKGRRYEYQALKELQIKERCQITARHAGSKGIFDIWGLRLDPEKASLYLVQVKAHKGARTLKRVLPKSERQIFIDRIQKNNFTWADQKIRGIPKWADFIFFQVWLWIYRKGWKKFQWNFVKQDWSEIIEVE